MTKQSTTPAAGLPSFPFTECLVLQLLQGKVLTLQSLCDRYHNDLSIEPEDFIGPEGYFAAGLDHTPVEFHGEHFELVWPADFQAFADAGFGAGGAL